MLLRNQVGVVVKIANKAVIINSPLKLIYIKDLES